VTALDTPAPPGTGTGRRRHRRRRPAWRLLLDHLRPYRGRLLAGGLLGFLGGLAALAQPLLAKRIVDTLDERRSVLGPVLLLTAVLLGAAALNAAGTYLLGRAGESVVLTARQRLVSRLLRLRVGAADRLDPGDLLSRVVSDTTLLRSVSTYGLVQTVNAVFLLAGSLVVMALLDLLLLGVTLAVLTANWLAVLLVLPRIRRATERSQAAVGDVSTSLERSLGALRTVKANGVEDRAFATVDAAARQAWRRGVEVARWTAVMEASAGLAVQASFLVVLAVGGTRVSGGQLPVSSLIAFLLYLLLLSEPLTGLSTGATQLQAGLAAVVRMRELQDLPVEPVAGPSRPGSPAGAGPASVAFDRVWFRYSPDEGTPWIHCGLTVTVPPGGVTAVVGPSGTGKTTLFALLLRFYEPQRGTISVDGRDIARWPLPDLRAAIGYVEQEAPVLAGTLEENLRLAEPDASAEDVAEVLRITRLEGVVARLPDGTDSPVGSRGLTLSGGERQRVAIARALLRRPRILLLDEATSQLDAANERALREVVAEAGRTTTVLVVAHRLSSVVDADRILVLDGGRVRAVGTHAELLERDALYRELAAGQLLDADGSTSAVSSAPYTFGI
jgi:ABC-type multidrug transport system fused ATPase/permease subunit